MKKFRILGRPAPQFPEAVVLLGFFAALGMQGQTPLPVSLFAGNAQHTANYPAAAQNMETIRWSTSVDLSNTGATIHYGAPLITAGNTVLAPVKTAGNRFQISAFNGGTGAPLYTLQSDYLLPTYNWIPAYNPALVATSAGTRLYYPGAGGTIYYIDNPDLAPSGPPVQQAFYGLVNYQANTAAFQSSVFIDTPITSDSNGNIFFGFRVQGTAPAPLATTQSGFARIDSTGHATYVLAGVATGDSLIGRDSHNSAPALSHDETTIYVLAKAASADSYAYLLGLDSTTLATKYKVLLLDPRNGNYAAVTDDSTASPMIAPDSDVYIGVLGNPDGGYRGLLLRFSNDLSVTKTPGAFGWDFTPAVVPASMVPSYTGSSLYLIFCKYNNYAAAGDGDGVNRIALLDPNGTQIDPHPSANGLIEMREVLTVTGVTPDTEEIAAGYPLAVREWCVNTPAVNPATKSIFTPSEDGHIYRWDLSKNSLSQALALTQGLGEAYVPVVIGPDGTVYTINGGTLFAAGNRTGVEISLSASAQDLRNIVAGQPFTFTAAVVNSAAGPAPAGSVTFQAMSFQGAEPVTTTVASNVPLDSTGHASTTTSSLPAGASFISASYSGGASASLVEIIHAKAASTQLTSSLNPSKAGQAVTFTAAVLPSIAGSGVATGMVTFQDGVTVLAQVPLSLGAASFTTSALTLGKHAITAVYASDSFFPAGSGALTQSVATSPLSLAASGLLSGLGNSATNPANLTTEGVADWIHWGDSSLNRKSGGGSELSTYSIIGNAGILLYANDPRLLSWTDGAPAGTGTNDPLGVYLPNSAGSGFSFSAPADTTLRTLVVHVGGYFSAGTLTAHLSDSSAADFVDTTSPSTILYDRNYLLTYKAASGGQKLSVSWIETTNLGAGNVDLNAAALSIFAGAITADAGNPQTTTAGLAFPMKLQAAVTDVNDNPVSGATVTFSAPTGGATASFNGASTVTATTGTNGIAIAPTLSANTVAGSYYVMASVAGIPTTAAFSLTNAGGAPVSVTPLGGTPNDAVVTTPYTTALRASVADANNNPVSGATVTFSAPTSGPSALFNGQTSATAVTDSLGIVFAPSAVANGQAGSYLVTASVAPGVSANFYLTNTAGGNGSLSASANSSSAPVSLTAAGTSDWVHWGDSSLNRKATGHAQISTVDYAFTVNSNAQPESEIVQKFSPRLATFHPENMGIEIQGSDPRLMSWTDGSPSSSSSNNGNYFYIDYGTYISSGRSGFVITAPADAVTRTLTVYAGGNGTGGTLIAHLSDASAPDFADSTALVSGSYDRNYTFTYSAASPGQTLTVTWAMNSSIGNGNVTISAAALAAAPGPPPTGGSISGLGSSASTTASLTTEGTADWVHWGEAVLNRKAAVPAQISNYTVVGSGAVTSYTNDPRALTWSDGAPTASGSNNDGIYINSLQNGFSLTAPADTSTRILTVHVGGWLSGGTLTASLSDGSATPFVDSTAPTTGQYDRSYTLTYHAASAGQALTVSWVATSGAGNVTLNGAALALVGPRISAAAGTPQTTAVSSAFSTALQALLLDANNNPLSGVTVTFTAPSSGVSAAFGGAAATSAVTNAAGLATAPALTANAQTGSYTVTASAPGVSSPASFSLTNIAVVGTAMSITATAGTPQSAAVSSAFATSLQAAVKDANDNPVSGVTVTFTTPATGITAAFAGSATATAVTNAGGIATAPPLTAGAQIGSYVVSASLTGLATTASFALSNIAAPPASITATAGTPQSAGVNSAFTIPLQASVKDANGNPVSGVSVTFTAPSAGASAAFGGSPSATVLSNASGLAIAPALTANAKTGAYTVAAAATGITAGASFSLNNLSGLPASVSATAGTPQTAAVNTVFAAALQATVKDANNNPVSGVSVTFAAPSAGPGATFGGSTSTTSLTNGSGIAAAPVPAANSQAGSYNVSASVAGVSTAATFTLTNLPGLPASIAATAGTPQSTTAGTAFPALLQVTVRDAGNNPVSGITVTFTAPAAGPSAAFAASPTASAATNASGIATAPALIANTQVGSYTATASAAGVSGSASFALANSSPLSPTGIGLVQQAAGSNTGNNQNTLTVTLASRPGVNNLLVLMFDQPSAAQTITAVSGGTWTRLARNYTGNAGDAEIWVGTSPSSSAVTITGTISFGTFQPGYAIVAEFAGASPALDGAPLLTTSGTWPVTTPTLNTSSSAGDLLISSTLSSNGGGIDATIRSPWALFTGPGRTYSLSGAYQITSAASSYSATWSGAGSPQVATISLALKAAGGQSSLSATAGTPQATTVNSAFVSGLQATLTSAGQPVSGATVTFSAPSTGPSAAFLGLSSATAVTNSSGVATAPAPTANRQAGAYTVTATAPGVAAPANFALSNSAGLPAIVSAVAGTPQSTAPGTAFSTALQASVTDANNNPVSGVMVTFAAPASGATGAFNGLAITTAATNASGIAIAPALTANSQAGLYIVTASIAGVPATANFSLTNSVVSSVAASLVQQAAGLNSGNNQNTLSVTLPKSPAPGNVLVLIFDQVSAAQSISSLSGATWTRLARNYTTNIGDSEIWLGTNPASSTITLTGVTSFSGFQPGYAVVAEFTGISPTLDGSALLSAAGTWPVTTASLGVSTAGDLLITSALSYSGGGVSASIRSPWTLFTPPAGTHSLAAAYQIVGLAGSYSATWNGSGSPQVATIILALK